MSKCLIKIDVNYRYAVLLKLRRKMSNLTKIRLETDINELLYIYDNKK